MSTTECSKCSKTDEKTSKLLPCGDSLCDPCYKNNSFVKCLKCNREFAKPLYYQSKLDKQKYYEVDFKKLSIELYEWTSELYQKLSASALPGYIGQLVDENAEEIKRKWREIARRNFVVNLSDLDNDLFKTKNALKQILKNEIQILDGYFNGHLEPLKNDINNNKINDQPSFFKHMTSINLLHRFNQAIIKNCKLKIDWNPGTSVIKIEHLSQIERLNNKLELAVCTQMRFESEIHDMCILEFLNTIIVLNSTENTLTAQDLGFQLPTYRLTCQVFEILDDENHFSSIETNGTFIYIARNLNSALMLCNMNEVMPGLCAFDIVSQTSSLEKTDKSISDACMMCIVGSNVYSCDTNQNKVHIHDLKLNYRRSILFKFKPLSVQVIDMIMAMSTDVGLVFWNLITHKIVGQYPRIHGRVNRVEEYFYVTAHKPRKAFYVFTSRGKFSKEILIHHTMDMSDNIRDGRLIFHNHNFYLLSMNANTVYRI